MPAETDEEHPNIKELRELDPELIEPLMQPDSVVRVLGMLTSKYNAEVPATPAGDRAWELCGLYLLNHNRPHEALGVFRALYDQKLDAEKGGNRIHKGMPLVWMSECFARLGYNVHAKRYLMLTLCEDALRGNGIVSPVESGVYFRLVWGHGLSDEQLTQYAKKFFDLSKQFPEYASFPEDLLLRVDDAWLSEFPSPREAAAYFINDRYVTRLIDHLGDKTGKTLEQLAEYLLSCMPGCRTRQRGISKSTDYDIICTMEGFDLDFRSELGRYFVCECKDWKSPADFTVFAKFCRVLDSIKSRFGILFSKSGISGEGNTTAAEREQIKVFQDRGVVIVVVDLGDLKRVAEGANFITLLRSKYEVVRLDLKRALQPLALSSSMPMDPKACAVAARFSFVAIRRAALPGLALLASRAVARSSAPLFCLFSPATGWSEVRVKWTTRTESLLTSFIAAVFMAMRFGPSSRSSETSGG